MLIRFLSSGFSCRRVFVPPGFCRHFARRLVRAQLAPALITIIIDIIIITIIADRPLGVSRLRAVIITIIIVITIIIMTSTERTERQTAAAAR